MRRAWTAALHGPRCCTQRPKAGDRLDAGHMASGDAVQEGMPEGIVVVGTVHGDAHLLHGSVIALKDRLRHQSGAVVRPPGFGLHREQSHAASFKAGQRHRHVAGGAVAHDQTGRAAHSVLTTALHAPSCCTGRPGLEAGKKPVNRRLATRCRTGRLGGAVGVGTVHGDAHLLHGSGITLKDRPRHQSGAVVRPPGFGLHREQGMASFRDRHAERLPPAPSRTAGRAARGLDDGPALRRATLVSATCRLAALRAPLWRTHGWTTAVAWTGASRRGMRVWSQHRQTGCTGTGAPGRARHVCVEPVLRFDIALWTQGAATMPGSARWASSR